MTTPPTIAVLVASRGRPQELTHLLSALDRQTQQPEQVVLSVTEQADLPPGPLASYATAVMSAVGSCRQRNAALEALDPAIDVFAFFDDDYLPSRTALAGIGRLFDEYPDILAANGVLLADGIRGPGLSFEAARELVDRFDAASAPKAQLADGWATYGCNMVFRAKTARDRRFDERLPLNGWQEDVDFSSPLLTLGRIVKSNAFVGVHRGVKGARVSGKRFGYSQVANPLYLARKGTMPVPYAAKLIFRNFAINLARSMSPEPWVDRSGRLSGNLAALGDAFRGRVYPERILEL